MYLSSICSQVYSCRYSIIHLSWFHPPFKGFRGSTLRSEWNKEEISRCWWCHSCQHVYLLFCCLPLTQVFLEHSTDFTSLASLSSFFQPSEKCSQVTGEGTNINTNFGQLVSHAVISPTFDFQCSISRKMTYTYNCFLCPPVNGSFFSLCFKGGVCSWVWDYAKASA